MDLLSNLKTSALYYLRNITVEPTVFLSLVGTIVFGTAAVDATYTRYCDVYAKYYVDDVLTTRCSDRTSWTEGLEDGVQSWSANWDIYTSIASTVPSIFAGLFLGAWGDKHGRAVNIAIGLGGTAVTQFTSLLVISQKYKIGLWVAIIGQVVSGITGTFTLVPINMFAYLSDITKDPKLLAFRITMVYATVNLSLIVGNLLTVALVASLEIQTVALVGFIIFASPFFLAIWMIPQIPPLLLKPLDQLSPETQRRRSTLSSSYRRSSGVSEGLTETCGILKDVGRNVTDCLRTFFKKRDGHRRCFLLCMAFFYFTLMAIFNETKGSLIQYYTYRSKGERAINWDAELFSIWQAVTGTLGLIGSIVGIIILKRLLKVRDTVIVLFGLGSRLGKVLLIGLASQSWHMYLASAVGMIADITRPGIYGFTAYLVAKDETGKAYTIFGLAENLAFIVGTTVFDNIYKATLPFFAGFLFIVIAVVLFVCELIMLWIHFLAPTEGIGIEERKGSIDAFELKYENDHAN